MSPWVRPAGVVESGVRRAPRDAVGEVGCGTDVDLRGGVAAAAGLPGAPAVAHDSRRSTGLPQHVLQSMR